MDAFDKLAKLAGASVESVGEGLPRTRQEAIALGVTWYFTGRPCLRGHVVERYVSTRKCIECGRQQARQYRATPDGAEYLRQYRATPEARESQRERMRRRSATPEHKEYRHQYCAMPETKERERRRARRSNWAKAGDAVLFAINQAEQAARKARAPADIITQCPEPQRSQLQALVDRIKADPQAGKAVVGLLRTMRELRKAELAEMRAAPEGGAA